MVYAFYDLAGVGGIEPTNAGIKIRCLTAWRHPNKNLLYSQATVDTGKLAARKVL